MNQTSSAEITMSDMREIHESFNRHDVEKRSANSAAAIALSRNGW